MDFCFPSPVMPRRRGFDPEFPLIRLRVLQPGKSGNREHTAAAEMGDQLVGLVSVLHPESPSGARWYRRAAMIEGLVLLPNAMYEDLGGYLVRHAMKVAKDWGAECICVRVAEGDTELLALYRSLGFLRDRQGDRVGGRRLLEAFTKPLAPVIESIG